MKKIDAVLIDDMPKNVRLLKHFLSTYCPKINVVGQATTSKDAVTLLNRLKPKVIFLDIELDVGTGFDVLSKLIYHDYKVIFVTSHENYAIKAFKYNAIDYILKPIAVEDIVLAVNKVYEDIENRQFTGEEQIIHLAKSLTKKIPLTFLAVPSIDRIEFIQFEDILYLKSEGRYVEFYLQKKQKIVSSKNLGKLEKLLNPQQFYRIHNSYIINIKYLKRVIKTDGNYCQLIDNICLPIAIRRHEKFLKFLEVK